MATVLLADLVATSAQVADVRSRSAKVAALAGALRAAAPGDVGTVTAYLSGVVRQRRTGLGWRSLAALPPPATIGTLLVEDVDDTLQTVSALAGPGSQRRRGALVSDLFARATAEEQHFLRRLLTGELRQGAQDGLMLEAVAAAADVPAALVRRAAMLAGTTVPVAVAALTKGSAGLDTFGLRVGRPVRPMLAATAADLTEGLVRAAPQGAAVAVERKLDGIRIQVHKYGGQVGVFTRTLEDITGRVPEVVQAVAALTAEAMILDGEAIALDETGAPRPFQETAARTASRVDVAALRKRVPLTSYFFDLLHLNGRDLIDLPAGERVAALTGAVPPGLLVARLVTADRDAAADFLQNSVAAGHEGVVVKNLAAPYEAGRRGAGWVKVKPRHTLDLVVLAVEEGSGRRAGWLSNVHLGARNPETGGFVMLGKTFKGMTDETLRWQTERFRQLQTSRSGHVVRLRPEQVVEVAFDGIQASPRYPGGMALRFARVVRYRQDKTAREADTLETVRALHGST